MDKKKVMGHNPLGINHLKDAKFKFIPFTDSGSANQNASNSPKRKKKRVVSYYLEEDLINTIREKATEKEQSFSTYVGKALKRAIED